MKQIIISRSSETRPWAVGLVACAIAISSLTGCACLVKKPEITRVRKIAVVSVYSNSVIYNLSGGGDLTTGIAALKALASDSKSGTQRFGGTRIVEAAYQIFSAELGKIPGWKVMPLSELENSSQFTEWKASVKKVNGEGAFLSELSEKNWTQHASLPRVTVSRHDGPTSTPARLLAEAAKKLGVDGVAVVAFDVAYQNYTAFGGTGSATTSVAVGLKVVNPDGQIVVVGEDVGKNQGMRYSSDTKILVVAGNIDFNDQVEGMLKESLYKAAVDYRARIEDGMKGE